MTNKVMPYLEPLASIVAAKTDNLLSFWNTLNHISKTKQIQKTYAPNFDFSVEIHIPRDGKSVRNLKKQCSYRKVKLYPSPKNDRMIHCESHIERKFAHLLEFHPEVISYKEQPCKINWTDSNDKNTYHIPDFRVDFRNGNTLIAEVKPNISIEDPDIAHRTEFLGKAIPSKYGFQYLLIIESQLDGVEQENADILRKFSKEPISTIDFENARRVFEAANNSLCLDDIKSTRKSGDSKKLKETVKALIRIGVVIFDMSEKFNNKTQLKWTDKGL